MKKPFLLLVVLTLISFQLHSSVFDSFKPLNLLETENFDIIFDDNSIKEGFLIYDNCEEAYKEIVDFYALKRTQRINVVITSDYQMLNAYFSFFPSPHIVLYNTVAVNNDLNIFSSDYLLNIFKHELSHALTLFGENTFVRKVFSQNLAYSYLNITSFTAEGLAMISESSNGEGRLNSPYYLSRILQARVEDKFPHYYEVQGNRDVYPRDFNYLYASFFNQFLINTYGLDKYREYLNGLNSFQLFFVSANYAFKKVYDKNIFNVYEDFKNSFKLLDVKEIDYEKLNYSPSVITKANDSVYVYESKNDRVRDIISEKNIAKLVSSTYHISYGEDKLILSRYKNDPFPKTFITVVERGEKHHLNIDNFKMAISFKDFIVGIHNEGSIQFIAFLQNEKIVKKIQIPENEFVQKLDVLNDNIVFLSKYEGKNCISIIDSDNSRTIYKVDKGIEIIDFSLSQRKIILSSVENNTLSRLSYIDTLSEKLFINDFDVSGGVNSPVILDDNVYYIANLFEEKELRVAPLSEFSFKERFLSIEKNIFETPITDKFNLEEIGKYNLFKYLHQGTFLPFAYYDGKGVSALLFYQTVDPAEYLDIQILLTSKLYGDINTDLSINLSSYSYYKYSSLNFSLTNLASSEFYSLITYKRNRTFDFSNNDFLSIEFQTQFNNKMQVLLNPTIGYGFETRMGQSINNSLGLFVYYNPTGLYNFEDNSFDYGNVIGADIKLPYLLFFIKYDKATINLPVKINVEYDLKNNNFLYNVSLLLFEKGINSSFIRLPIYFHNVQLYGNYNYSKNKISASLIFSSSFAQTRILTGKLSPGLRYSYDFDTGEDEFEISLFAQF